MEEQSYIGASGRTLTGWTSMGYCKIRKTYKLGTTLLLKEEYLDGKDQPTRNRSFVYGRVLEYDDRDRLIREYTYGENGQPYSGNRRYSITEYSYDATGARTATHYSSGGWRVD